ncbi:uncharacterized protein EV422DRAFT_523391 [Fimicolochytrium jonesii]|uniref:uncharacterized protein n=1 Tax=Fimicolochytrium jonesii TaxID=1396493 RepID=UPI0022FED343|nr:uncharacterized protein EV422DRAFT_523391 [Fimicolochytrium jonesii]KAI8823100.1 hypothetical protein EV422DRAFT_523391 [Fimicolochytrium jonesii]
MSSGPSGAPAAGPGDEFDNLTRAQLISLMTDLGLSGKNKKTAVIRDTLRAHAMVKANQREREEKQTNNPAGVDTELQPNDQQTAEEATPGDAFPGYPSPSEKRPAGLDVAVGQRRSRRGRAVVNDGVGMESSEGAGGKEVDGLVDGVIAAAPEAEAVDVTAQMEGFETDAAGQLQEPVAQKVGTDTESHDHSNLLSDSSNHIKLHFAKDGQKSIAAHEEPAAAEVEATSAHADASVEKMMEEIGPGDYMASDAQEDGSASSRTMSPRNSRSETSEEKDSQAGSQTEGATPSAQDAAVPSVADFLKKQDMDAFQTVFEKEELMDWAVVRAVGVETLRALGMTAGAAIRFVLAVKELSADTAAPEEVNLTIPVTSIQSLLEELKSLNVSSTNKTKTNLPQRRAKTAPPTTTTHRRTHTASTTTSDTNAIAPIAPAAEPMNLSKPDPYKRLHSAISALTPKRGSVAPPITTTTTNAPPVRTTNASRLRAQRLLNNSVPDSGFLGSGKVGEAAAGVAGVAPAGGVTGRGRLAPAPVNRYFAPGTPAANGKKGRQVTVGVTKRG